MIGASLLDNIDKSILLTEELKRDLTDFLNDNDDADVEEVISNHLEKEFGFILKYLRHTIIENDDLSVFDLKANMTKAFI
jgi:hypothetical protein